MPKSSHVFRYRLRNWCEYTIDWALVINSVYHLSLRAVQVFLSSVVELMKLTLPIPDCSTVRHRQGALALSEALTVGNGRGSRSPRFVVRWHGVVIY